MTKYYDLIESFDYNEHLKKMKLEPMTHRHITELEINLAAKYEIQVENSNLSENLLTREKRNA